MTQEESVMNYNLEIALRYKAVLGESPVWDDRRNVLFWIDNLDNKACIFDPKTGENKAFDVGQNIGTLILTDNLDEVIVGLERGIYSLNLKNGQLTFRVDPEAECAGNRMNDGKADAAGRIWIGSMCIDDNGIEGYDTAYKCNLHRIDAHFCSTIVNSQIRLSNGMAWTKDNKTMYYIDSPTRSVYQYDFDIKTGEISNQCECIHIPAEFGICDGMDIDIEGNLWIAHWTGWCVGKWDPHTGKLLGKIEIPVCRVASCAFGGENYEELYIVTASINTDKDGKEQPEAGYVFVAKDLGTRGLPFYRFRR